MPHVLSPNLILFADARHYYPLIINASQAIRVPTSLVMLSVTRGGVEKDYLPEPVVGFTLPEKN